MILEQSILKQFDIKTDMRIIISYTSTPMDKNKKEEPYWENKKFENAWQKIYKDSHLIPTTSCKNVHLIPTTAEDIHVALQEREDEPDYNEERL